MKYELIKKAIENANKMNTIIFYTNDFEYTYNIDEYKINTKSIIFSYQGTNYLEINENGAIFSIGNGILIDNIFFYNLEDIKKIEVL